MANQFFTGIGQGFRDAFDFPNLGQNIGKGLVGAGGAAIGGLAGGLIGNGYQSEVGSTLNALGDLAGSIPGIGGMVGGGLKLLGGIGNAAFGMKVDQETLNAAAQGTNYLNNFSSNAASFDDIQGPNAIAGIGTVYKGGWFTGGKARRKNEELQRQRDIAQSYALRSVDNNVNNIAQAQMDNMLASFAAFGGPLHTNGSDWRNGVTIIGNGGTHEQSPLDGVPMGIAPDGQPNLVEEGEVIYNDYVYSNRLRVPKSAMDKYKLKGKEGMTFADAAKLVQKESEERPNDSISRRTLDYTMGILMEAQEKERIKRENRKNRKNRNKSYLVGESYDVSDEEANRLRELGYEFEIG